MAGRGATTFQKRQKEQQRKEKQQEKFAKRMQRSQEKGEGGEADLLDDSARPEQSVSDADLKAVLEKMGLNERLG
jgi:hypothetical protein